MRKKLDKPKGILLSNEAPSFTLQRYFAAPELDAFVEHYWVAQWDLRQHSERLVETLPHPSVHVVFEYGDTQVFGIMTRRFVRTLHDRGRAVGVKFRPGGFAPFVEPPVAHLTNKIVPTTELFSDPPAAAATADAAIEQVLTNVETWLLLQRPVATDSMRAAQSAVECIAADRTITHVDHLVVRLGVGKRALQRLFHGFVGVPPKWVIQRARLHEAAEQLAQGDVNMADLALELGYVDQAHFIRDFKRTVGKAPGAYGRLGVKRQ